MWVAKQIHDQVAFSNLQETLFTGPVKAVFLLGIINPMIGPVGGGTVETQIEHQHLVPGKRLPVTGETAQIQQTDKRDGADKMVIPYRAPVGFHQMPGKVNPFNPLVQRNGISGNITLQRLHILYGPASGIEEGAVVGAVVPVAEIADDLLLVGKREKPAHGILIQPVQIGGIQLLVVGDQELLRNGPAEPRIKHRLERSDRNLPALEQITQAVFNVNFYDSCVIEEMLRTIDRAKATLPTWRNTETGEMLTTLQVFERNDYYEEA